MSRIFTAFLVILTLGYLQAQAATSNGFNLDNASIPIAEIFSGGPPKDGIPAINHPKFVSIKDATFLHNEDRIIGVIINNVARGYPIKILNHHELVNDRIGDQSFTVSYCPLCGTGMVFTTNFGANENGNARIFGVSGLLYNSDVLLYDRSTLSLWSQIMKEAISGKLKGQKLTQIPALHTNLAEWKEKHPESEILSIDTGFHRNYNRSAYQGYERSRQIWFEVSQKAPQNYHPKEQVMGVEVNGMFKAYPFIELSKQGKTSFTDELNGLKINIQWNESSRSASVQSDKGITLNSTVAYWFAWFTFHPETLIFTAAENRNY